MSLDFYLESEPRECVCSQCDSKIMRCEEIFWINITHNLGKMAGKAGIYQVLWHPNDNGQVTAGDILETLKSGYSDLLNRPEYFKQFDASNGWGTYEHFVPFVKSCLDACESNPLALVRASI
jgi:hypothetical protein